MAIAKQFDYTDLDLDYTDSTDAETAAYMYGSIPSHHSVTASTGENTYTRNSKEITKKKMKKKKRKK